MGGVCAPGLAVMDLFPFSTRLSTKFILLINIKMPILVGIVIFIRRKNFMLSTIEQEEIVVPYKLYVLGHWKY